MIRCWFGFNKNRFLFKSKIQTIPKYIQNSLSNNIDKNNSKLNNINSDLVSPSHPFSNLRLIKFAKHENESNYEKEFRIKRIKLQEWNHNYWLNNNNAFKKEKSEFIEKELNGLKSEESFKPSISYEELSLFYKRFLDQNHRKHMTYNFEWYKRHTSLLWPAIVVLILRLRRKLF